MHVMVPVMAVPDQSRGTWSGCNGDTNAAACVFGQDLNSSTRGLSLSGTEFRFWSGRPMPIPLHGGSSNHRDVGAISDIPNERDREL